MLQRSFRVAFTPCEWTLMTELYQSEDVAQLKKAVAILTLWRARSGNSVHVAADMTELLLRAEILDKETDEKDWFSVGNVRIVYAVVVIRFVNYVNELCQSKTRHLTAITRAVQKVNIPPWVVQVRHQAAHGHLPSIKVFRKTAKFCRQWLWENHWSLPMRLAMQGLDVDRNTSTNIEIASDIIITYITFRMKNLDKTAEELQQSEIMIKIKECVLSDPVIFIRALLLDGYLLMTKEQLENAKIDVDDGNEIWVLPARLQLFWQPVLKVLLDADALPEMLYQIITELNTSRITHCNGRQLVGWADRMLSTFFKTDFLSQEDWKRIMKAMLLVPEEFKQEHFNSVIDKMEALSDKKRSHLRRLVSLHPKKRRRTSEMSEFSRKWEIKTLADLHKLACSTVDSKTKADLVTGEDNWISSEPSEWRGVPLGLTPEQSAESLYLILEER